MTSLTTPHASSNPLVSPKINHAAIRVPDFEVAVAFEVIQSITQ
jgi:hypothetical protein